MLSRLTPGLLFLILISTEAIVYFLSDSNRWVFQKLLLLFQCTIIGQNRIMKSSEHSPNGRSDWGNGNKTIWNHGVSIMNSSAIYDRNVFDYDGRIIIILTSHRGYIVKCILWLFFFLKHFFFSNKFIVRICCARVLFK